MIWECEGVVNFEFGEDYSTHLFAGFHRYFVDEGMELLPEHQLTLENEIRRVTALDQFVAIGVRDGQNTNNRDGHSTQSHRQQQVAIPV